MAVRADAEEDEVERGPAQLLLVRLRGQGGAELAADAVHRRLATRGEALEEVLADEAEVRVLVLRRHGALVAEPDVRAAPVRLERGGELVGAAGGRAAAERDVASAADGLDQQLRGPRLRVVEDLERDLGAQTSASASSRERSIAAWIAFRNAARTPARSSSRIARIVVPPGEVTFSRSSTGCIPSSRSSFAVPNIVWTTSCVEISRDRPRRIPASIMASARSAKYAGPEPETAVTASIESSGRRTTRPRWARTSSAMPRWPSSAWAPALMPAMPSCTVDGVFGIARTTGTSPP